jgi:hypothetical protein
MDDCLLASAEVYGPLVDEELLGEAPAPRRSRSCCARARANPTELKEKARDLKSLLPHAADFFRGFDHRLAGFAPERLSELGHIDHDAVDAVGSRRMGVDLGAHA